MIGSVVLAASGAFLMGVFIFFCGLLVALIAHRKYGKPNG